MVACLFLTVILPVTISGLIRSFENSIYTRSEMTPIVVGPEGSALDLTMRSLYFNRGSVEDPAATIALTEQEEVVRDGLAIAIPVHCLYRAKEFPIVGTTGDYFRFRELKIAEGAPLAILGECLIGADCADALGLEPGDQLLSDRPNLLDLAGDYPLKMTVAGVFEKSGSPDDRGVFVDLKTAWIIQGLGHGHQDLESPEQDEMVEREEGRIEALPYAVVPYTEITESNIDSFHFHGDTGTFPVSAIIGVPKDIKSATLLEARYQKNDRGVQFVRPVESIKELMSVLLRVRQFFMVNTILITVSTLLLTLLVLLLSLKLRQGERETMFKLGCRSGTIMMLQTIEILIVIVVATVLVLAVSWLGASMASSYFDSWITRGGSW
jgi:putative ABC transport system permease protein